ncbi:MAG: hypothetical protein AAGA75_27985, partial [Cyanobacteria bacterium P01_E01_bin.6]
MAIRCKAGVWRQFKTLMGKDKCLGSSPWRIADRYSARKSPVLYWEVPETTKFKERLSSGFFKLTEAQQNSALSFLALDRSCFKACNWGAKLVVVCNVLLGKVFGQRSLIRGGEAQRSSLPSHSGQEDVLGWIVGRF